MTKADANASAQINIRKSDMWNTIETVSDTHFMRITIATAKFFYCPQVKKKKKKNDRQPIKH